MNSMKDKKNCINNNLNFRIEELKHRILDLEKVNIKLKEDDE